MEGHEFRFGALTVISGGIFKSRFKVSLPHKAWTQEVPFNERMILLALNFAVMST